MTRKKPRVVLDTNVLYSGLYSSRGASYRVLRAVEAGTITMVISTTLLFEYEDILMRNKTVLGLSEGEIERLLDYFCLQSEHQKVYFLWRPLLPDPKDDHLLELAVASNTKTIITHNTKDFIGTREFGIRTTTPKELLEEMP